MAATRNVSRRHEQGHLSRVGGAQQVLGRRDVGDPLVLDRRDFHRALAIDDVRHRQVAQAGLREHQLAEPARIARDGRCRLVEVLGHVDDVGADHLSVLVEIGVRHVQRVAHDRDGLLVEPVVERARERGGGGNRQQQGRQRGDQAEEDDDAGMQPRARHLLLPCAPQADAVHGDDGDHGHDQQQVHEQHDVDDALARCDRRQVGQDQERRQRPDHRQADDDEADPEGAAAGARQRRRIGFQQRIGRGLGPLHHPPHAPGGFGNGRTRAPCAIPQCGTQPCRGLGEVCDDLLSAHQGAICCSKAITQIKLHCGIFATLWLSHLPGERQERPAPVVGLCHGRHHGPGNRASPAHRATFPPPCYGTR